MGIPQVILIVIYAIGLAISLERHGEVQAKRENFFTSLFAVFIVFALLICGGFFN